MNYSRKKLIVIHGSGSTIREALGKLRDILNCEIRWNRGSCFFKTSDILLIRTLLNTPNEDPLRTLFQRVLTARMMLASTTPAPRPQGAYVEYPEERLIRYFGHFGIPLTYYERRYRARTILKRTGRKLDTTLRKITYMHRESRREDRPMLTESAMRERFSLHPDYEDVYRLAEEIRNIHEAGSDTDSVACAALYTHFILQDAAAQEHPLRYGKDYEYAFVQYHEGLRHLAAYAPCDVLIADLPTKAIPDLDGDIRFLADHNVFIERFEDHHPCTEEMHAVCNRLQQKHMLGYYELPRENGGENGPSEPVTRCGADIVYENLIKETPYDSAGCTTLQQAAHGEEFGIRNSGIGKTLTEIVHYNICKNEIVQTLVEGCADDRFMHHFKERGWIDLLSQWKEFFSAREDRLLENVFLLECTPPKDHPVEYGRGYGPGSDTVIRQPAKGDTEKSLRILFTRTVHVKGKKPELSHEQAAAYYRKQFSAIDYLFYCYGAHLVLCLRFNQADCSLDPQTIVPELGAKGDGIFTTATICRPSENIHYPKTLLGAINRRNFRRFVEYMGNRLDRLGYKKVAIRDLSTQTDHTTRRKGIRLLLTLCALFAAGLLLLVLNSSHTHKQIQESNSTYFPQILQDR